MNKRLLVVALVALAAVLPHSVFAIAASQAWVADYVGDYVGNYVSNFFVHAAATSVGGTTVADFDDTLHFTVNSGTDDELVLEIQKFTDAALVATNCTALAEADGVVDGTCFVWNGAGEYVNPACESIFATSSNLVFRSVASVPTNGVERFEGWFDAVGVLLQRDRSFAITNIVEEVSP